MKRLSTLLAITLILGLIVSCKGGSGNTTSKSGAAQKSLSIEIFEGGYGRDFIDQLTTEFKKTHPDITISISGTPLYPKIRASLKAGPKVTKTDLFFAVDNVFDLIAEGETIPGFPVIVEDLTDLYNQTPAGENKTLKEKLNPEYHNYYKINDKIYSFPWAGGGNGLAYNKAIFDANGWKVPRTTNELIALSAKIKAKGKIAFMNAGGYDYWKMVYEIWWAQYEGKANFDNFWQGKYTDGKLKPEIFLQQGRLQCLQVLNNLINPTLGYIDTKANAYDFTQAQLYFLRGDTVMMPSGDWLENEMRNSTKPGSTQIVFMKTPVISSLGTKLGITEEQLVSIIDFADGLGKKPAGISEEIVKAVTDARKMVNTIGVRHAAFIPAYSSNKDLAKEFLKFMASDKGLEIYTRATNGNTLPFEFDIKANTELYNTLSVFQKSKYDILKDSILIYDNAKSPLVNKAGLVAFTIQGGRVEAVFGASNPADRKTPEEVLAFEYNAVKGQRWTDMLQLAGLL